MSIEINGVTLPDLPADVLAQYPYAFVYQGWTSMSNETGLNEQLYYLVLSKTVFVYIPKNVYKDDTTNAVYANVNGFVRSSAAGYRTYKCNVGDSSWTYMTYSDTYAADYIDGEMSTTIGTEQLVVAEYPRWFNHTVYIVSDYDDTTTPYTYTLTDRVYIPGAPIVSLDDYPPIPDDLSYSYPYVSIGEMTYRTLDTNQLLATLGTILIKTTQPLVYIPMELIPGYGTMFVALTDGSISYECKTGGTTWEDPSESNQEVFIPEIMLQDETENIKVCIEPKAANYDVKEIDLVGSEAAGELVFSRTVIPATGTPPIIPEPSYSISRFDLLKLARKIRQLEGTTNGMSVSEMGYATSRITFIEDAEGMVF